MLPNLRIVLVRSRNPLNIGAVARAMANFGLEQLVLVDPYTEAWREAKSARAGAGVLQHTRIAATLLEAVADCHTVVGTSAGTARVTELPLENWGEVAATLREGHSALVFGSERTGLGVEEISHCNRLARIPTLPGTASMNLGQAVAVCAYELARQNEAGRLPAPAPPAVIAAAERERTLAIWYPILEHIGVVKPAHRASQTRALREMLVRWQLTPGDQNRVLGVARQLKRLLGMPR